ncbi:uncharacterized protein MYCGRDRAFT_42010 [Zymoseptoria tritici IPO323]|uniref:AAA+ ATPase domain-containing protein n=1 Tax=Zymoseptoria tritici (strain CBS 115943 / IPO323) TaxID=336722 RepID=F9XAI0_ZYMTI|nr:uncharacterized protein MYCGRDRAFT_42010 [Zymoseptoria tritici IPO323]EGP87761.1 hypothetical protein MYCGRDRAFT_42010 [Zymoseptoria tritici IPO323]
MADGAQRGGTSSRSEKVARLLHAFITGLRPVRTTRDCQQFIDAICDQPGRADCIEKLGCSTSGLDVLHQSLRFDPSVAFLNGPLHRLLLYLAVPEVKRLCNGEYLRRVLKGMVSPTSLWDKFVQAQQRNHLTAEAQRSFAWLLLEILLWSSDQPPGAEAVASEITAQRTFLDSSDRHLRAIGYRIEHILKAKKTGTNIPTASGPGGRHDNDFIDFRHVAIYPTKDELTTKDPPYYNPAHTLYQVPSEERVAHHLSNQFRLLREDFLAELRLDLNPVPGKGARRPRTKLSNLQFRGVFNGGEKNRSSTAIVVSAKKGFGELANSTNPRAYLKHNHTFLKHSSFGYFIDRGDVVAFGTIHREEDLLCQKPPAIAIRTPGSGAMRRTLLALAESTTVQFVIIDTAVFAYEPVLKCLQAKHELPLWEHLLCSEDSSKRLGLSQPSEALSEVTNAIQSKQDLQAVLGLAKSITLDDSQTESLLAGLRQSVSLIQGPPGTGKSFVGALLAKALHDNTSENILVVCYTNHALDQFLEDLMDIGIPNSSIVRLGSKSTARTQPLTLYEQAPAKFRTRENWDAINRLGEETTSHAATLDQASTTLRSLKASGPQLLQYLELSEHDYEFFEAFEVPESEEGFTTVGQDGREIDESYLLQRWIHGDDAGVFGQEMSPWHHEIWSMDPYARQAKVGEWQYAMLVEAVDDVVDRAHACDASQYTLSQALSRKATEMIQQKRIVACTTTGAAMYSSQIQSAAPGIVLVEEAGEILESHVLTAMTPDTKQLILIGDHKQLRPKVNNYSLTVEKGDGFDLNRSLFERLVMAGFPHTTLTQQHRMCPEISNLVRQLTYPDILDAPSTLQREALRGLQNRVVFIEHTKLELLSPVADRRDHGASVSKQNEHEVEMVKKIVKYMAQQGYGTSSQVVLTPYLGQLSLLRRKLAEDNDPVLNDLDSFDLIQAGLLTPASASQIKRPLQISTVDNYQGNEADIVIVSLTRSNPDGDIGFLISPERLNVLLSRARKALIIIGNSATFKASKKGGELWSSFFNLLAETNSMQEGLPVQCSQHPDRKMLLTCPDDFDQQCPDGGCSAPCGVLLNCGKHACERKCHQLADHSKIACSFPIQGLCAKGHRLRWTCATGHPVSCRTCDIEAAALRAQQERNAKLDQERQARQAAYALQLAAAQEELDRLRQTAKDRRTEEEQAAELAQRQLDLVNARTLAAQREAAEKKKASDSARAKPTKAQVDRISTTSSDDNAENSESEAQLDWNRQKATEGASNKAIDSLMAMIGLEAVKDQFLEIKSQIDLLVRQDLSVEKERFGAVLMGNPGTGKTTVARIYAKFLCSIGALPGDVFVESTGAKLASEGVAGCKKMIEDLLDQGGGAFFIDEAYQLASGSNFGGSAVLDFLLPEAENLTGKVVFILAGYNKQMEKFFQHNPGLPSRFPRRLQFADYEDHELLAIMNYNINKRYNGRMELKDGAAGLFARIVARRIGRGRGKEGFGNAREVENVVSKIAARQAKRVRKERRKVKGKRQDTNDLLFTDRDLIGPEPTNALLTNQSWKKLQQLTGLRDVKEAIQSLLDSIKLNYERELAEEPLVEYSLNKVFLGNPGTGKTTVAKLYGQILADLGMLSSGEVVIKTPTDFVGAVIGASEANTKGILDAAVGKVLVIDEAYGLFGGHSGATDPYRTGVIDTIVAEVQSVPGEDRCVLLLGYKEQMEEMMQHVNPGLARRFPMDSGFIFQEFDDEDMEAILEMKLKAQAFKITDRAKDVALGMLQRARNRPHFGNAGEVDIILNDAKLRQQKRISRDSSVAKGIFEAEDFDPDFERGERANTNLAALFKDSVACDGIVKQLQGYQNVVARMREHNLDPREEIPFTFLFRGPPGTGKTTTARKMGKVYYDMGFLSKAEVVTCSASDLVGEYVGHSGPKTRKLLESALGKVLFIDEAYRLAGGHFAQEAVDELVDGITNERFSRKLIIVLAGYNDQINQLLRTNPGLNSRFPESIVFVSFPPKECLNLLIKNLRKKKLLDIACITSMSPSEEGQILQRFQTLASLQNFGNARDVETMARTIFGSLLKSAPSKTASMSVTRDLVLSVLDEMVTERSRREIDSTVAGAAFPPAPFRAQESTTHATKAETYTATNTQHICAPEVAADPGAVEESPANPADAVDEPPSSPPFTSSVRRDVGVSDAIWEQLQLDQATADREEQDFRRLQEEERKLAEWLKACEDAKQREELRELERKRKAVEEERRRQILAKEKLKQMGCCPVGYHWIKQASGYRCAGGSHFMSDDAVDAML